MNIQDRTYEFLQNLKAIKQATLLSDAYKEEINLNLKLVSVNNGLPCIEIFNKLDYENVVNYIIKEINNPNFIFHISKYNEIYKYLILSM